MGLLKQIEFAEKCGIGRNSLNVYKKRGKIILTEDGLVNDQHPLNVQFLQKCLAKPAKPAKEVSEKPREDEKPVVEKEKNPQKARISEKKNPDTAKFEERFDLDTAKKKMEIEKLHRESRLAEMQHEKIIGKLVPTDPIKSLFIQTIKSYTMSFKQAADKIISEFGKRNKMNRNDMAEMRAELVNAINKAAEDGMSESKKSVMNIVKEYSQAKKA